MSPYRTMNPVDQPTQTVAVVKPLEVGDVVYLASDERMHLPMTVIERGESTVVCACVKKTSMGKEYFTGHFETVEVPFAAVGRAVPFMSSLTGLSGRKWTRGT
jgi:hypothetical protein